LLLSEGDDVRADALAEASIKSTYRYFARMLCSVTFIWWYHIELLFCGKTTVGANVELDEPKPNRLGERELKLN
jgi:hypothetical protein